MTINQLRETVQHHRDLVLAYLRLEGHRSQNAAQHAVFAREFTLLKREVA